MANWELIQLVNANEVSSRIISLEETARVPVYGQGEETELQIQRGEIRREVMV